MKREVFVVLPGGLFVIVLDGPAEVALSLSAAFQGLLARLELLE